MKREQKNPLDLPAVILAAIELTAEGITVADARHPSMPLIFANRAFYEMMGYSLEETLGRNCRFLQGPGTDPQAVQKIRDSLNQQKSCVVEMLNYRKDGTPFWNRVSLAPVFDNNGELQYYVGIQSDITAAKQAAEDQARLHGMRATIETVNDILLNFLNVLQYFRMYIDDTLVEEYDVLYKKTLANLKKISDLTEYRERTVAGVSLLDIEKEW